MPKRGGLKEGRRTWDPGLRALSHWLSGSISTLWRGRNMRGGEHGGTSGWTAIREQEGTKAIHALTRCPCWDPSPPTRLQLPQSHDLRKSWFSQSSLNLTSSLDEPIRSVRVSLEKPHRNSGSLQISWVPSNSIRPTVEINHRSDADIKISQKCPVVWIISFSSSQRGHLRTGTSKVVPLIKGKRG